MVYVHVPFCESFCTYCGFYSEICSPDSAREVQNLYVRALRREIEERRQEIGATLATDTLYIGGGTPSVLPAELLGQIVDSLGGGPWKEFTVEVNPEDIIRKGPAYAGALVAMGVTRVSMGVQSLSDRVLRFMGRRHDAEGAKRAVEILRGAGVGNLSLDLIFGISGMSDEEWRSSVEGVLALHPEHISAYQLSIDPESALASMVERGDYVECPEEDCRAQYDFLCRRLGEAGYVHYEVSNFALPGKEAIHNSAYWKRVPYVGLGPGAHSFDGAGERKWNGTGLAGWSSSSESLSAEDEAVERIMLSLRTAAGIDAEELASIADEDAVTRLKASGSLVLTQEGRMRIAEDRFFVSDEIIRELI